MTIWDNLSIDSISIFDDSPECSKRNKRNNQSPVRVRIIVHGNWTDGNRCRCRRKVCVTVIIVKLVITVIALVTALIISQKTNSDVKCGTTTKINHGWSKNTGTKSGSVTSYYCVYGYHGVGNKTVFCQDNGQWSKLNFECKKDCPKAPTVSRSTNIVTVNMTGVYASYRCISGFYKDGEPGIVCQDGGVWSHIKFKCLKYCGKPPAVSFSTYRVSGYTSVAITSYYCWSGYVFVGNSLIYCKSNGAWTTTYMSCLKDCGIPPNKALFRTDYSSTYVGSKVTYYCKNDNKRNGSATCQNNGKWSAVPVSCQQKKPNYSGSITILNNRSWMFLLVFGRMMYLLI